ncbi:MAG: HAMP domain-containing histidine kinase [Chloroflexi bacterium]|nr:HAMP domain-containing histidine kinase [Chloroflexota bacterium]
MVDEPAAAVPATRVLADIADVLESCTDADLRLRQVLTMVGQLVPYDVCAVLETRPEHERFIMLPEESSAAELRSTLLDLIGELSEQPLRPTVVQASRMTWPSHLALPLISLDNVIGVLLVASSQDNHYSSTDVSTLAVVAAQLAAYLTSLFLAEETAAEKRQLDAQISRGNALYTSEQQARALAEAAVHLRDEFLASVSHDLRTPLTSIKGRAQWLHRTMLRGAVDGQHILDELQALIDASTRMALQIDQLFAVARERIEAGLPLSVESTDFVALVQQCVRELSPPHEERVQLETSVQRLVGEWDGVRIARACSNLLSNALKYSPDGTPVRVTIEPQERDGKPGVRLRVIDQGIGVPADEAREIFEAFHRARNSSGFAGTGLGLAGSKASIEQHGGTIEVTSREGQGATFTVWLPLHPPAGPHRGAAVSS